eukprot:174714-Prorocentrum_minimum.AAC.1
MGDSQMLDFFKAAACAMVEFVDMHAGPPKPEGAVQNIAFQIPHTYTHSSTFGCSCTINAVTESHSLANQSPRFEHHCCCDR